MPTLDPQDTLPSATPDSDDILPEQGIAADEDASPVAAQSEVAMRINLLGKLIIPPSVP